MTDKRWRRLIQAGHKSSERIPCGEASAAAIVALTAAAPFAALRAFDEVRLLQRRVLVVLSSMTSTSVVFDRFKDLSIGTVPSVSDSSGELRVALCPEPFFGFPVAHPSSRDVGTFQLLREGCFSTFNVNGE